jgi:hypothetical protein
MADIFWDGFDKYGLLNSIPSTSSMGSEWTNLPSNGNPSFVAGRFTNSLALQLGFGYSAGRTLPGNYPRLIGGVAMQPTLSSSSGVLFADAGTNQCSVGFNAQGKLVLWQGGIGGTQIAISSTSITTNTWHYVEWDLTFASSGAYTVWLDGAQVFTGTGNLKSSSNAYANAVLLSGNSCNFDDMYLFDNTGTVNNAVRGDSRVETLFPNADASVAFTPSQGAIGAYYTLSGSTSNMSSNQLFLRKFTVPVAGTLNSIGIMPVATSASANFKPAVYADNNGTPGTLLSSGPQVTGTTSGTAITLALTTAQTLAAGGAIWLGYIADTSLTMQRQDNGNYSTNAGYTASVAYSSGAPSTAPGMSSGQPSIQIWGNVTGMASNFSETNEVPPGGDLSCVTSSTVGAEDRYSFGSLSSTPSNIAGVKVSALMRKTDSGARTVSVQLKSGSAEVSGAAQSPSASYTYFAAYQDTDPNTNAAWTASGINSLTAGAKIAS